jgi:uncharacterized SAM-binding protein YcdF (DUF218 family)
VFLLQKIVGALLEPPGILVVGCILVLGIKRFRKYGLIFLTLLIYCLSTGLGLRLLQINSFAFVIPPQAKPQAIVVLGGGTFFDQKTGEHTLHPVSITRLLQGYFLFQKEPLPFFVSGGNPWGHDLKSEGELMREILLRLGVPEEKIVVEARARTTWENAQFLTPLLKARHITTFYLVSSQVHLQRALFTFRRFYPESLAIPISAHPAYDRMSLHLEDFLPSLEAFSASSTLFHEWWGLQLYRFKAKHLPVE